MDYKQKWMIIKMIRFFIVEINNYKNIKKINNNNSFKVNNNKIIYN